MGTRVPLWRDVSGKRLMPLPHPRMRRRGLAAAVFVSAAALLAVVSSAGAGVLDQSQPVLSNISTDINDRDNLAQTFTSGRTGALDQVDVAVGRQAASASLRVEIRPVSSGVPSGPALASEILPAASVPPFTVPTPFVSVRLAPPVPVTAGVQYAIVVSSQSCGFLNCYEQVITPGDLYPTGAAYFSHNAGATWGPVVVYELPFKTYVLEPPTSKQQCKKGGWRKFRNPSFKNQGQCVKFVNHHGSTPGNAGKAKDAPGKEGRQEEVVRRPYTPPGHGRKSD
jgi:hypothetical protein